MPRNRRDPQHYPDHSHLKIIQEGELLVTGRGHVTVEEPLRRTRALLIRSEEAILVTFKEDEPPCPPCAGEEPDEIEWELIEKRRELLLKIRWRVSCARTIVWKIFEVE